MQITGQDSLFGLKCFGNFGVECCFVRSLSGNSDMIR